MKRRRFAALATVGCGLALPLLAQQPRIPRLAVLAAFGPSVPNAVPIWNAFYGELAARGWSDGRSISVDARYNEGRPERNSALAAELLAAQPDAILCTSSDAVDATRRLTRSISIVMAGVSHAVEAGFVQSMARPGGNVTGVTNQAGDMQSKFVELLREARPGLKRLGIVWSMGNVGSALAFKDAEAVAASKGMHVVSLPLERATDVEAVLQIADREGVQALHIHPTAGVGFAWRRIVAWANERKVVTLGQAHWVTGGCLMSYWASNSEVFRIAAGYVDRVLRGAVPADMPVEQPTRFELRVNLQTARIIGITLPQSLLMRADEVIDAR